MHLIISFRDLHKQESNERSYLGVVSKVYIIFWGWIQPYLLYFCSSTQWHYFIMLWFWWYYDFTLKISYNNSKHAFGRYRSFIYKVLKNYHAKTLTHKQLVINLYCILIWLWHCVGGFMLWSICVPFGHLKAPDASNFWCVGHWLCKQRNGKFYSSSFHVKSKCVLF